MAADPGVPRHVRRVGSLRLRRRRELRRARRLHRPLPDRPRRRRRGRGRPALGHRRDLEPPLVRQPPGRRPARAHRRRRRLERRRSSGALVPNNPTGVWVGDYTDPAGERRARRVRARVRPRPRSAGPLRHVGQHRRRRELDRLLDADVLGRQHRRRRARRDRRRPDRPRRVGEVPARLARRQGDRAVLRGRAGRREAGSSSARTARPRTAQQALFVVLPDKKVRSSSARQPAAVAVLLQRLGRRPRHLDDEDVRPTGARSPPRCATRSRRTGTTRSSRSRPRRHHVDAVITNLLADPRPTTRAVQHERHRHHRLARGGAWVDLTADLPAGTDAVRFRYRTDGPSAEPGFAVDDIAVDGTPSARPRPTRGLDLRRLPDDDRLRDQVVLQRLCRREPRLPRLRHVAARRRTTSASSTRSPDWVESYRYQDGLLISYWDTSSRTTTSATIRAAA